MRGYKCLDARLVDRPCISPAQQRIEVSHLAGRRFVVLLDDSTVERRRRIAIDDSERHGKASKGHIDQKLGD